jgi:hypothetical protein
MPVVESSSIVFAYLILAAGGLVPLAVAGPGQESAFTIAGSMAACLFVILSLVGKRRGERIFVRAAMVMLSGMFCGNVLPGIIMPWKFPELVPLFTWHHYAGLGFLFAMAGQRFVSWLVGFIDTRFPAVLDKGADFLLGIKPHSDDDTKTKP